MVSDSKSVQSRRGPEARREALLRAAAARFDSADVGSIRMADVAVDAGVAKGTVFLHFSTKEALFLALCEQELFAWLDELDERLRALGPSTAATVAATLTATLLPRRRLCRLLSILAAVLERNVDLELIVGWKQRLGARLLVTGARLEGCLLFLPLRSRIFSSAVCRRPRTRPPPWHSCAAPPWRFRRRCSRAGWPYR
jgi:AcrR family transcriptional regulator